MRGPLALVLIVGSFSFAIVYTNAQSYDARVAAATGYSDTAIYIGMFYGSPEPSLTSGRPLVPLLARLVPDLPRGRLFGPERYETRERLAANKFAVVNLLFLVASALLLGRLQLGFGLTPAQSFLGILVFLSAPPIVRSAGLPMPDSAFYFFLLVCAIAIQRRNAWLFLVGTSVGVLAKELILLALPLVLFTPMNWRRRVGFLVATIPALALYLVSSAYGASQLPDYLLRSPLAPLEPGREGLRALGTLNGWLKLFLSFGLAWVPALYALFRCQIPELLWRWRWWILIVLAVVLATAVNLARIPFAAFPVVAPLAAVALHSWGRGMLQERSDVGVPNG